MSKLNLNDYSDRQIVSAILDLPASKFITAMNALGDIAKKMEQRGKVISQDHSDDIIDKLMRDMFNE